MKTTQNLVTNKIFNGFAALSILSSVLLFGCLNPIGFSPEVKIKAEIEGEISIDNINSAELQFRNHTASIDVYKIDIERRKEDKPTPSTQLDARITGSPIAGRQDSVFVRPVGKNVLNTINVLGYTITFNYRTAEQIKNLPASSTDPNIQQLIDLKTDLDSKGVLNVDGKLEINVDELPRGKCVIHIYRDKDYKLHAEIGDTYDKLLSDYFADKDFIQDIRIQNQGSSIVNNINLDNLEVSVARLPPVRVEFSPEITQAITELHLKLADIRDAIVSSGNNVANATVTAGDAIAKAIVESNGTSPYGRNYSVLLIQNWTEQTVKDVLISQTATFDNSAVAVAFNRGNLGLMDQGLGQMYAVLKNGAWDSSVTMGNGASYLFNNLVVPAQKYLHIYEKTNGYGVYASEKEWGTIVSNNTLVDISQKYKYDDWKYGRIEVQNYSAAELAGIEFKKRDNTVQTFYIMDIAPGKGNTRAEISGYSNPEIYNPGKAMSSGVVAGDYLITILTKDGSTVLADHNTTIKAEKFTSGNDNKIYVFQDDIISSQPPDITYWITQNGGLGDPYDAGYDTTELTFTFDSDVSGTPSITKTAGAAAAGALTRVNARVFTMKITTSVVTVETLAFTCGTAGIDSSSHQVNVFKHDTRQIPTTTRYIYKNSGTSPGSMANPVIRGQTTDLNWFFEYDIVTYQSGVETGRQTVHKDKYGSWLQDAVSLASYITFTTTDTSASIYVGPRPPGNNVVFYAFDDGSSPWPFKRGLVFGNNVKTVYVDSGIFGIKVPKSINVGTNVVDGHVIEGMPKSFVPIYGVGVTTDVEIYGHQIDMMIQN